MMPELFLDPKEELKLYLVQQNMLQASKIQLSTTKEYLRNYVSKGIPELGTEGPLEPITVLKKSTITKFKNFLTKQKIYFVECLPWIKTTFTETTTKPEAIFSFYISKDFNNLLKAVNQKDITEQLKTLGWPTEEIEPFITKSEQILLDENYVLAKIAKAKKQKKLPLWVAYLTFIPANIDVVKQSFLPSTKQYCSKIRDYVADNNPDLAARIEKEFFEEPRPHEWIFTNGQYALRYETIELKKHRNLARARQLN